MAGDDPREPPAVSRTVFAPNPGRRRTAAEQRAQPLGPLESVSSRPGVNALVDAGAELFDLVVYLKAQTTPLDVVVVREKIVTLVREFERRAQKTRAEQAVVAVARYAICATIDDQILSSPWGMDSGWQQRTLVSLLGDEVIGGDRFFELLEQAEGDPDKYGHLIEFMYICLSLGFQGRYRRERRRADEDLDRRRTSAFGAIEQSRGGFRDRLSLSWTGVDTIRKPLRDLAPTWLVAAAAVFLTAGLFVAAQVMTGGDAARAIATADEMPPLTIEGRRAPIEIVRVTEAAPYQVVETKLDEIEVLKPFLIDEINEGLVELFEQAGEARIRLLGAGMFAPAKAQVLRRYVDVVDRVAVALDEVDGEVVIEGHTDSDPINTVRFPSNTHLSRARAEAVEALLAQKMRNPQRLRVVPFGDETPLVENTTRENKALNRRVEIVLISGDPDEGG